MTDNKLEKRVNSLEQRLEKRLATVQDLLFHTAVLLMGLILFSFLALALVIASMHH